MGEQTKAIMILLQTLDELHNDVVTQILDATSFDDPLITNLDVRNFANNARAIQLEALNAYNEFCSHLAEAFETKDEMVKQLMAKQACKELLPLIKTLPLAQKNYVLNYGIEKVIARFERVESNEPQLHKVEGTPINARAPTGSAVPSDTLFGKAINSLPVNDENRANIKNASFSFSK